MHRQGSTYLHGPSKRSLERNQNEAALIVGSTGDVSGSQDRLSIHREGEIRQGLVARVRHEIAAGIYDTPERLELALARLFEQIDLD